jgi:hypothetical protein
MQVSDSEDEITYADIWSKFEMNFDAQDKPVGYSEVPAPAPSAPMLTPTPAQTRVQIYLDDIDTSGHELDPRLNELMNRFVRT